MAALFLDNEEQIITTARRVNEPFVFAVGQNGLRRARVRYPIDGADH
ncbi:hypothetical protein [Acrocarpospora corrugata]|nr:hypothetical protein [Acrocarpospora corrugata]